MNYEGESPLIRASPNRPAPISSEVSRYGYATFRSPTVIVTDRRGAVVAYRSGGDCDWDGSAFRALVQELLR